MTGKQLGFIIKPPTTRSSLEAASLLIRRRSEAVFLNLPRSMDSLVTGYMLGMGYDEMINEVRRRELLPEPVEAWLKESKPILDRLREERQEVCTFCYKDDGAFEAEARDALDIALLTLRDSVRESISIRGWVEVLSRERERRPAIENEVEYVIGEARNYDNSVCISGFEGKEIKRHAEALMETWVAYVGLPYHFTPIEILRREMAKGEVTEERLSALIRQHIKFIRELVIPKDLDMALEEWTRKNLYWLGRYFQ